MIAAIVDDDLVEQSNLNKLIGSTPSDIGTKKSLFLVQDQTEWKLALLFLVPVLFFPVLTTILEGKK